MLAEIESAIISRLDAKAPQIRYADIPRGRVHIAASPSFMLTIARGAAERVTMKAFKQRVDIVMWVRVSNLRDDSSRRKGAYPLLEAIAQYLFDEKLGLDISAIDYKGFTDVSLQEEIDAGVGVFQVDFETSYTTRKADEEEVDDLLVTSLSILLNGKPVLDGKISQGESHES